MIFDFKYFAIRMDQPEKCQNINFIDFREIHILKIYTMINSWQISYIYRKNVFFFLSLNHFKFYLLTMVLCICISFESITVYNFKI